MAKKRYTRQQIKKLVEKKCYFCGEDNYDLLDAHRIIPGEEGGKYHDHNILVVCATHHRKIHSGCIVILGKHYSTLGRWLLHYVENGEEKWL